MHRSADARLGAAAPGAAAPTASRSLAPASVETLAPAVSDRPPAASAENRPASGSRRLEILSSAAPGSGTASPTRRIGKPFSRGVDPAGFGSTYQAVHAAYPRFTSTSAKNR